MAVCYRSDKVHGYLAGFGFGHGYTRVYHTLFKPLRRAPVALLEIGLLRPNTANAGQSRNVITRAPSLEMWRRYFHAARLHGLDLCAYEGPPIPDCIILQGDQGSASDLQRVAAASPGGFDIVIDDGSHASQHQQISFRELFPHVRPGGYYAIEDLGWQPEQIEDGRFPKTADMFREYLCTGRLSSPAWSAELGRDLASQIESALFFDSLSRGALDGVDWLLVLRKRQAS
ncbi:class I SAM-dependent methyltransferase [Rhodoligotrophos defluvii]|uniref:class I SAM-dependent methyltransferase n=1 Tax=Rhodoligotrophos defluvii TaxID=2561934 RepID=UPI0010CA02DD|nr:class I SAM-dependent methyltransferase [Rhodoligotrophos defluvii]